MVWASMPCSHYHSGLYRQARELACWQDACGTCDGHVMAWECLLCCNL